MKKYILCLFIILFVVTCCGKNITIEQLEHIHDEVDSKIKEYEDTNGKKYTNVSSTSVDQKLMKVVVYLIDDSEKNQNWFKENIYDSEYIIFEHGEINTTLNTSVSLMVKQDTLTKNGATFIIKNNTDKEFCYGEKWSVEKLENGIFKEVETLLGHPLTWNEIAYILKANEEREIVVDWSYSYGQLEDGEYRLVKTVFKEEDRPIDESKEIYVYAEFTIKTYSNEKIEVVKNEMQNANKFNIYLKKDEVVVYLSSSIEDIYLNGENRQSLKSFLSTFQTIDDAIKKVTDFMDNVEVLRDGGTKIYKSSKYDLTIVKCNTVSGNRDYFIGNYSMNFDSDLMCKR